MKKAEHTTLDTLPSLTAAQKNDLKRLAAMSDNEIDTSDLPEMSATQLARMKRPEHYRGLPIPHECDPASGYE